MWWCQWNTSLIAAMKSSLIDGIGGACGACASWGVAPLVSKFSIGCVVAYRHAGLHYPRLLRYAINHQAQSGETTAGLIIQWVIRYMQVLHFASSIGLANESEVSQWDSKSSARRAASHRPR